ncbi:MAG: leucine--tRNA ligase [Flavobacteriaceae bacterium]|nr:leucine--tRNA ligase [Flavobacteriaceae bacterium]
MEYNFKQIEKDWQKYWADNQTFKAEQPSDKPKYYVLDMFPYPSGAGLHVGHPLGYIASDIFARYKRHKGFNVLHPQGYDSFGLPAEQYAIQTGQHPAETTKANIATYRKQLDQIGFSFDWSREFRTSDSSYYKWTQWIFTKLYDSWYNKSSDKAESISILVSEFEKAGNASVKAVCDDDIEEFTATDWSAFSSVEKQQVLLKYRLTYLSDTEVNWCPGLGTVLANDEIINGLSERGGHEVVRKKMKQWSMRISAYADRLLSGLDTIDWPAPLKDSQTNWIGKSKGALVSFNTEDNKHKIEVFTTRPDTIYGVSFMVLAPEHELVNQITTAEQKQAIEDYVFETSKRSERDRMADVKNVSGCFTGAYATNPFTGKLIPIWIADYVLAGYGTGAIMAVPSGDQRDWDFATKFDIEIPNILADKDGNAIDISEAAYDGKDTFMQNSDTLNGLNYKKASKLVLKEIYDKKIGEAKVNFRLRDAVFSRQRYWGEPFPVYYKDGMPQMIDVKHLPIELPEVDKYLPTEDGAPPLGNAENWAWDTVNNKTVSNSLIDGETVFALELNTMPGWAGSSWYFNRYMDSDNNGEFVSKEASDYWQDIDLYIGGSEHATGHLLYARFWQKFLFDLDLVPKDEFAKKLINQGMILGTSAFVYRIEGTNKYVSKGLKKDYKTAAIHVDVNIVNSSSELDTEAFKNWRADYKDAEFVLEDGKYIVGHEVEKMSKSKYNVVNPDIICQQYGADALRLFEMFLGPLEQAKPWQTSGISGVYSFLKKLWKLYIVDGEFSVSDEAASKDEEKILHKTIKKVEEDISNFSFNTSVSTFMIAVNELTALKCNKRAILEPLSVLLSPYAPHIAEELWAKMGNKDSIAFTEFPVLDESKLVEDSKVYPISFNGKMRFTMELSLSLSKDEIEKEVMAHEKTIAQLDGRTPKKVIIVPGKIVNIVG